MLRFLCLLAALVVCISANTPGEAKGLPGSVAKTLKKYKIPSSALSVVIQGVRSQSPRVRLNGATARNPASTMKLVTSWAALDALGPAHTFKTDIFALGPVKKGVLTGDLAIRGRGDPYLVLEELWKMLGELRRLGIREIRGDLLIDNSLHSLEPNTPGAFDGGTHRLYNVIPTALTVNFNATRFIFNAAGAPKGQRITTVPGLPNLNIQDRLKRTRSRCNSRNIDVRMQVVDSTDVRFTGKLPAACVNYELSRSTMDTADYAFGAFKSTWAQWGGTITGALKQGAVPAGRKPLMVWDSRPLAELLRPVNKWSNNVMARLLLYAVAAKRKPPPVSRADGAKAVAAHLKQRGLETSKLVIDNGSGLSRTARVSADFLNALLIKAWHEPHMPEFISSMSISGIDGTLRTRFRRGKERGRMHLKTGLLKNVISISGYVLAASGRVYAVTMILNHGRARNGSGRALQNAVLKWVHAQ
ncbi:MAG: D-alanyl-D-alanine carboxypeptidase/D-alanyl-D-alanine-endopeptidase [Pseudomonadota bacterium]